MGKVRHKDRSLMTVVFEVNSLYVIFIFDIMGYNLLSCFQLKQIVLRNDQYLYCMWITREVDCFVRDNSMASPDPSNKNQQVHIYIHVHVCTLLHRKERAGYQEGSVATSYVGMTKFISLFYFIF